MFQRVNGCGIHYEIRQNSNAVGTPVLFLHGWGCDMGFFSGTMDAMQEQATLIALDFPAHGESEEPPQPWGVKEFAEQVKQLLENNHIGKADIVAHSFGARVAIWLAAHDPQMIGKIVITGGAGLKKPESKASTGRTAQYKRLKAIVSFFMKAPFLKQSMEKMQEILVQKYGSADYAKLSKGMRASFVKIISEDLTPLLSKIAAPTLLIWGGNDQETPLWMGKTMEREIPDAGLVIFEGRSHFAFLEESARFLMIVKQFLWGGNAG